MMNDPGKEPDGRKHGLTAPSVKLKAPREISSEALFEGRREILITHENKAYRLRITNQGKLVLNL